MDGQLALFVGAGVSHLAQTASGRRLPLWAELAQKVAERCQEDQACYRDVLDLFDAIAFGQERGTLERAVRELLDDQELEPSPAHRALARLPWAAVLSTNYDGLLARTLDEGPVWDEDGYDRLGDRALPRLFQVHGTLERPHTLTRDDYRLWSEKHPRAYRHLEGLLLRGTMLFVGYSLSDPHLEALLATVRRITARRKKRLYAWMWQVHPSQARLLDQRDKIETSSIDQEDGWARAFEQIEDALPELRVGGGGASPPADRHAYERAQYVQALESRYGTANLQGLYVSGAGYARGDVMLAEVYVEPHLLCRDLDEGPEARGSGSLGRARRDEEEVREAPSGREPASRVVGREGRLVVIGAPGQGKSTLLRRCLLEAARRWRERPDGEPFSVYLRLADWEAAGAGGAPDLLGYATATLPRLGEMGSDAVRAWLAGRVLWLLDGVDEVRDRALRERLREEITATAALRPADRWVVATRPAGEPLGGFAAGWRRSEMLAFDESQVRQILVRWASVLERKEGLRFDPARMHSALARDRGLARLQGNPLLLTLAVLFYKSRRRLPHDRWEFYDVADQVLRDSWLQHRLHHADGQLPGMYLPELLERLALLGMVAGKAAFTREELERECRALLVARDYGGAERDRECALFVRAAEDLIGVLVGQGPGSFGFLHLTFQEFLAARALCHRSAEVAGVLARFWDHPGWEEVWRLYALAIESDVARYAELIHETLGHPHLLDTRMQRHRLACLSLIGVGSARLPDEAEEVVQWAIAVIREGAAPLHDQVLARLGRWERSPLAAGLRAALLEEVRRKRLRKSAVDALWVAARDAAEVRRALLARLGDPDPETRDAALRALSGVVDEDDVWRALLGVGEEDWRAVDWVAKDNATAVLSLAAGQEKVQRELLTRLGAEDYVTRATAAAALCGAVSEGKVLRALLARVRDEDWHVRAAAIRSLSETVWEEEVLPALLGGLGDAYPDVRSAAAYALSAAAEEKDVRDALRARLNDDVGFVRLAVAEALLGVAADDEARRSLLALIGDADKGFGIWLFTAHALAGAAGDPEVRRELVARLDDEECWVREAAVEALSGFSGEAAVRQALMARLGDRAYRVRARAARALAGEVGEDKVRKELLGRLGDQDESVRWEASRALAGAVGDEEVRRALLHFLTTERSRARMAAVQALAGAADREDVRSTLLPLLDDDDPETRGTAFKSLLAGIAAERERVVGAPKEQVESLSNLVCAFCAKKKRAMWWCRECRLHFCGDCAAGSLIRFACPRGHRDVVGVRSS
jgi:HEAT repeat protein